MILIVSGDMTAEKLRPLVENLWRFAFFGASSRKRPEIPPLTGSQI